MNLEMMGRHPDSEEPKWNQMTQMKSSVFHHLMREGQIKTFEVWDAPERNEKWPPTFFREPLRARRYVVKLLNHEHEYVLNGKKYKGILDENKSYWVDGVNEDFDRAVIDYANLSKTWYTYHQKPDVNKFNSWQYLGSAAGGFIFLTGSIYLGIVRKHSIPTDAIQAMEFAQSRADARKDAQVDVTLEDVGGLENIVEDLNEVIAFLKNPEKFKRLGAKPPKGLLMEGGPGVGKTLIAKAIAGEANVPFYSMSGSEFVEIIVGVGAARVRDLFKRARLNAPCLIFVDEIDALGTKRAAAGTRGTEEHEQTLNQLLTEMDGFTPDTGVVFVGATNRADLLDPALMRPGRFDRKVTVPQPGIDARAKILQIHLSKRNVDPEIDTLQFAKNLPGLSGAELANICNEAAALSVRRGGEMIESVDVLEAVDRVTNGLRHPSVDKSNDMVRRLTRHELGHALVASVLHRENGLIEPVERVSIVPRGRDPTQTTYNRKRDEDYLFPTRARLMERVQVLLAGRAAEEVFFGEATSYGSEDVRDANNLTRNIVVNYALGQPDLVTTYTYDPDALFTPERHLASRKSKVASTGEMNRHEWNRKIHGYGRAADYDHYQYAERKILQIINEAFANAKSVIEAHADAFEAAYEELLVRDVLSGARLGEILDAHPPRGDFPRRGPDTPCKILTSEDEEIEAGTRVIADPRKKTEHAVANYYPQVRVEIADLRDRTGGKPYGKEWKDVTLVDYMPEMKKSPEKRFRDVPLEPWSVIGMRENLQEDPDWLRNEFKRFTKVADDERLLELRETLVPRLEAKMAAAKFSGMPSETQVVEGTVKLSASSSSSAGEAVSGSGETARRSLFGKRVTTESRNYKRNAAHQKPGSDGLTDAERRKLRAYKTEIEAIEQRWRGDGWEPDDDDADLPILWRHSLVKSEEEMRLRFKLGPDEGTETYKLFQEIKEGFEKGGYVRCWNGKYYKKEECVLTQRGTWCREKDLAKEGAWFRKSSFRPKETWINYHGEFWEV
jgi:ATP-dependent metalloprotease FtsH